MNIVHPLPVTPGPRSRLGGRVSVPRCAIVRLASIGGRSSTPLPLQVTGMNGVMTGVGQIPSERGAGNFLTRCG